MPGVRTSFTVEATGLVASLKSYADTIQNGRPRYEIMREQMKFAIRAIIDLTPPETYAQGRRAVHADLTRAMSVWGGEDGLFSGIKNDGLRQRLVSYQRAGDYDKMKDIWSKIGRGSVLQLKDFSPQLHHSVQNNRGHVATEQNVMVPQRREWKEYLAHLQNQVGRARGGWVRSAQALGLTQPEWVTRHAEGGAFYSLLEPGKLTMVMINRAIFIPRYRQNVELALAGREKAMATDVRRWLDGEATHAGFGR